MIESAERERGAVPRSLRVASVLVTLLVSAAAASFVFRRTRRAVGWLAVEVAVIVVGLGAVAPRGGREMWGAIAAVYVVRIAAAVDAARLGRAATETAPLGRVIAAWLAVTVGVSAVVFGIRAFALEAFKIPSGSMMPTLLPGDHLMADKRGRHFERGDVVVHRYPNDPSVDYVKRVVAVGGDTVSFSGRTLAVNGRPVERRSLGACGPDIVRGPDDASACTLWEETLDGHRYVTMETDAGREQNPAPVLVPEGQVYVVGDNRDASADSRLWGPFDAALIKGRAAFIWYSSGPGGVRWDRANLPVR
jgi:signal peptidase I